VTEHFRRLEVAPVRQASRIERRPERWSLATSSQTTAVAELESIVPGARRKWDGLAGVLVVGALALALFKPWGAPLVEDVVAPAPLEPPTAAARTLSLEETRIPAMVFAPVAERCMDDIGWRVCAMSPSGEQTVRNVYATGVSADLGESEPAGASAPSAHGISEELTPAVILATVSGAALALYPPPGFYVALPSRADSAGGEPAWGTIAVAAWWVDPAASTRSIGLGTVGSVHLGSQVAGTVLTPLSAPLASAATWPAGRYVLWLKGGGAEPWQEFFDLEVTAGAAGR
jgi:hypothetical protein